MLLITYSIDEHNTENLQLCIAAQLWRERGTMVEGLWEKKLYDCEQVLCVMHNVSGICFIEHHDVFLYGF